MGDVRARRAGRGGRPRRLPFCRQAEPPRRGRGPCASAAAHDRQARPRLTPRPGVASVGPRGPARSLHPARPTDLPPGKQMHQRVPLAHPLFCMSSGRRGGTRSRQSATGRGVGREGRRGSGRSRSCGRATGEPSRRGPRFGDLHPTAQPESRGVRRPYINRSFYWVRPRDVTRPARLFHVIAVEGGARDSSMKGRGAGRERVRD